MPFPSYAGITAYASIVLVGQIIGLLTLFVYLLNREAPVLRWIAKWSLFLSFLVTSVAVSGTLYFSEILHLRPCTLCWFQRVSMYPLFFLFAIALLSRESEKKIIVDFASLMASLGAMISTIHYALQRLTPPGHPCQISGGDDVFCTQPYFLQFGYISIPLMALSAFLLILILMGLRRAVHSPLLPTLTSP